MSTPATNFETTTGTVSVGSDAGTPLGLAALLAGTLVGTVSNNVVNVPLDAILDDFGAPLGSGVFVVVGFLIAFAATVPLAGWIGDRFGRRRVYCAALLSTAICAVGAATAPSLPLLIAWRSLGGVAAAAFAPAVMGLIAWMFTGARRGRAVGAWASVNGIGQAVGPSMGGIVADAWGWRWVFVPLVPVALAGFAGTLRYVPRYRGVTYAVRSRRRDRLDGGLGAADVRTDADRTARGRVVAGHRHRRRRVPVLSWFGLALLAGAGSVRRRPAGGRITVRAQQFGGVRSDVLLWARPAGDPAVPRRRIFVGLGGRPGAVRGARHHGVAGARWSGGGWTGCGHGACCGPGLWC